MDDDWILRAFMDPTAITNRSAMFPSGRRRQPDNTCYSVTITNSQLGMSQAYAYVSFASVCESCCNKQHSN